jgi:hypothetical protein
MATYSHTDARPYEKWLKFFYGFFEKNRVNSSPLFGGGAHLYECIIRSDERNTGQSQAGREDAEW